MRLDQGKNGLRWLALVIALGFPAAASASPDFSGIYNIAGGPMGGGLNGFIPINSDLSPVVTAHLQPWAVTKMNVTDTEADDLGAICQQAGLFRHPTTVAGYMVVQEPGEIYLISTDLQEVGTRRIHLTDHHPSAIAPSWDGNSIGHWDGDTLVVDTVGFNDKSWLMSDMQPHTEELHLIERIRQVAGGSMLEITSTVEDREALRSPYQFSRYYAKQIGEYQPGECVLPPSEEKRWSDIRNEAIARDLQQERSQPDAAKIQP